MHASRGLIDAFLSVGGSDTRGMGYRDAGKPLPLRGNLSWPSCIILGAQKSATSSLFDALVRHPAVCGPSKGLSTGSVPKEVLYLQPS